MIMTVKIVDQTYTIEEVNSLDARLMLNGKQCYGVVQYGLQHIIIDQSPLLSSKIETLRHELCHAFIRETQLSIRDTYTEEEVCEMVGIYGPQIIRMADKFYGGESS